MDYATPFKLNQHAPRVLHYNVQYKGAFLLNVYAWITKFNVQEKFVSINAELLYIVIVGIGLKVKEYKNLILNKSLRKIILCKASKTITVPIQSVKLHG